MSSFTFLLAAFVVTAAAAAAAVDDRPNVSAALHGPCDAVRVATGRRLLQEVGSSDGTDEGAVGDEGDEGDEGADDPDDGNEGDEGDEGNEGNEGQEGDEGDEGDEGNEGNEGQEGDEGDEGAGGYVVCLGGAERREFGTVTNARRPDNIVVYANGTCEVAEYAGGFDGYFSVDVGDGHEDGFARACVELIGEEGVAVVGSEAGRRNVANDRVNEFMLAMRRRADPVDLEFPRDRAIADGGKRMENIRAVSDACTALIDVQPCSAGGGTVVVEEEDEPAGR